MQQIILCSGSLKRIKLKIPCKGGLVVRFLMRCVTFCQYPAGGLRGAGGKVSGKECLNSFMAYLRFGSPHFQFIYAALGTH